MKKLSIVQEGVSRSEDATRNNGALRQVHVTTAIYTVATLIGVLGFWSFEELLLCKKPKLYDTKYREKHYKHTGPPLIILQGT